MRDSPNRPRTFNRRKIHFAVLLAAAIAVCSLVATWRSYSFSDSLTFADVTVCADEGLLSLQIPLVRRAPETRPETHWITYQRGTDLWEAGSGGGKARLRNWMTILDIAGCEGGMVGGFGFWKGGWQSNSRPGPFIVMFVPIWAAIASGLIFGAAFCLRRTRFRVATMLLAVTLVSVMLWLLTLQAAPL